MTFAAHASTPLRLAFTSVNRCGPRGRRSFYLSDRFILPFRKSPSIITDLYRPIIGKGSESSTISSRRIRFDYCVQLLIRQLISNTTRSFPEALVVFSVHTFEDYSDISKYNKKHEGEVVRFETTLYTELSINRTE